MIVGFEGMPKGLMQVLHERGFIDAANVSKYHMQSALLQASILRSNSGERQVKYAVLAGHRRNRRESANDNLESYWGSK